MSQRDKNGLFKTYCESCGAKIYSASSDQPHPNCDQCPGHDDIARRDQEAADNGIRWRCFICGAARFRSHKALLEHQTKNCDGRYERQK